MAETFEQILDRALSKATDFGHDMQLLASGRDTAFYVCRKCKLAFTIGYISSSKRVKERRGVQLIADTALTTRCRTAITP